MLRVFISSTSKDLTAHREAVRDAVLKLGMHPVMMEHFPAMDANALQACQKKVLDCDLFIGIYAKRYGYTPAGNGQSITELEYAWAKAAALPQHIFVLKPSYEWPHEFSDMGDEYTKLEAFKARVGKERVWSEFTDPNSLAAAVTQSLAHDADRVSREQARQRRLMLGGLALITLLILGVIAALILTKANEKEIGISQADRASTNQAIAFANASASATLWTPTPTATPTATPSNTPTITPTPLEGAVAAEGETLLLIADFVRIDADATNIEPNLERQFEDAGIRYIRIHHTLASRDEARSILELYNATMIMWGDVARGGVRLQFEARDLPLAEMGFKFDQLNVAAVDVTSFDAYIFAGLGTDYIFYFTLGRVYFTQQAYDQALDALASAIKLIPDEQADDPSVSWLYMLRGRAYDAQGEITAAYQAYQQAAEVAADWGVPSVLVAYHAFVLADYPQAFAAADQALTLGIASPTLTDDEATGLTIIAYSLRGIAQVVRSQAGDEAITQADIERAIADLDQAITVGATQSTLNPFFRMADLYAERATAWQLLGNSDAALADYALALAQDPANVSIYILRGQLYQSMGQFQAALADFSQAIKLDVNNATAYRSRASVYIDLEDYEKSLADAEQAITLEPDNMLAYPYRAIAYGALGDYPAAIADYTLLVERDTAATDIQRAAWLASRAESYLLMDDDPQLDELALALADYNAAITLAPSATRYTRRALIYINLEDSSAALADFASAIALDPTFADAYYYRAWFYVGLDENCALAQADYDAYVALGQSDEDLRVSLTYICSRPTVVPTPVPDQAVTDPLFPDGTTLTLPGPRPVVLLTEPLTGQPSIFCTPSTTATALQTRQITNGTRWVQLECDAGTGWYDESKLPPP